MDIASNARARDLETYRPVFKSYDVRGQFGVEITEELADLIGRAFVKTLGAKRIAIGRDMRKHSPILEDALVCGITAAGADAVRIGQCSTPMSYFAAATLDVDGAIMVTASHNPGQDNGFKFCKRGAEPMGKGAGLEKVEALVISGEAASVQGPTGRDSTCDLLGSWCKHLKQYLPEVRPMTLVLDFSSGVMGPIIKALLREVDPAGTKIRAIGICDEPDGTFPWHLADPLKPVNRQHVEGAILAARQAAGQVDLGIVFDGDGDRIFFLDENARFIGGDLVTALFARELLSQPENRGKHVMYDLRSSAVVKEEIEAAGGAAEMCRVGHSHIKAAMRGKRQRAVRDPNVTGDTIFAGELSGHLYFTDCFYLDTSERAFLLALQVLTDDPRPISEQIKPLRRYWQSGEINYRLPSDELKEEVLRAIERDFNDRPMFKLDGVSVEASDWHFNVRLSNTEPVVRVTAESLKSEAELRALLSGIERLILRLGGSRQLR